MRLTKKSKTFLVLFLITSFINSAIADPGRSIQLNSGESIPWNGWCFDEQATSIIIIDKEMRDQKCKLKIEQELEKKKALFDFEIGKLRANLEYEINTKQIEIDSLIKQNNKLEETLINNNKYDWLTYGVAGFAIGAITMALVGTFVYEE